MSCVHAAVALGKNDNLIQKHSQEYEGGSDNVRTVSENRSQTLNTIHSSHTKNILKIFSEYMNVFLITS